VRTMTSRFWHLSMPKIIIFALLVVTGVFTPALSRSASATVVTTTSNGFDACSAPSTATMDNWWINSPYYWVGVYIGGVDRSCSQPNLTSSWVSHVVSTGWNIVPIWAGLQDPCYSGGGSLFSTDPTTAYSQGQSEASSAVGALIGLGINVGTSGNAEVVDDLEAFNQTPTCVAAAQAFIKGWDAYLAVSPSQVSGVYGSSSGSDISALTGSPAPYFIWGAYWDLNQSTLDLPPIPSSAWSNSQRLKQYRGGHVETYGGVGINIDNDSANGPVYH